MKKLWILLFAGLLITTNLFADDPVRGRLNISQEDDNPTTWPYKLKVTNGTLTDNGDGTVSLNTGGGVSISDSAYGIAWNTDTTGGASRHSLYTKIESIIAGASQWTTNGSDIGFPNGGAGNVGIGLTNPSQKLEVSGQIKWNQNILPAGTGANNQILITDNLGNLTWGNQTGGSQTPLTGTVNGAGYGINNLGNIGIGVSSPGTAALAVMNGNLGIATTTPQGLLQVGTSPNPSLQVSVDGKVGIGTTPPAAAGLYVVGTINGTTDVKVNGTSVVTSLTTSTPTNLTGFIKGNGSVLSADNSTYLTSLSGALLANGTVGLSGNWLNGAFNIETLGSVGIGTTSVAAGLLQIGTAPGQALTVLANGNVGLGNTAPSTALQVNGTVTATNLAGTLTTAAQTNITSVGVLSGLTSTGDIKTLGNLGIGMTNPTVLLQAGTNPTPGLTVLANSNVGIGNTAPFGMLSAGTNPNIPALYVTVNGGNVGIGKTLPSQKLEVLGNILSTTVIATNLQITGTASGIGNTAPQGLLDVGTSPGVGLIVTTAGKVGIGTTAPAHLLDVGSTNANIGLTVDSAGNVGIGVSSPGALLEIKTISTAPGANLFIKSGSTAPSALSGIIMQSPNSNNCVHARMLSDTGPWEYLTVTCPSSD